MEEIYWLISEFYQLIESNINVYVVLLISLLCFQFLLIRWKSSLLIVLLVYLVYLVWGFGVEIILYGRGIISSYILIGYFVYVPIRFIRELAQRSLSSSDYKFYSLFSLFDFYGNIYSFAISIWVVLYLEYLQGRYVLKILFCIIFLLSSCLEYLRYRDRRKYFQSFDSKVEAYLILGRASGTTFIPFNVSIFIWNQLLLLGSIILIWSRLSSNKTNIGLFHTQNRTSLIADSRDNYWQFSLCLIIATIFISNGYNIDSYLFSFVVIGLWPLLRFVGQPLTKYYTVIVGEKINMRPKIYDNLINRVNPDESLSFWSKVHIGKSVNSYSLFFHNFRNVYDDHKKIINSNVLVSNSYHIIVIFHSRDQNYNWACEADLTIGLRSPIIIIDSWRASFQNQPFLFGDISGDFHWLEKRLEIVQLISDEPFGQIKESHSDHYNESELAKLQARDVNLRQAITNSSSFEALRQNIQVFEHHYTEGDHTRVKLLTGNGIYELNTLFRQLHESPSIPSRFIDLLNVAECAIRYLVGFAHAKRIANGTSIHGNLIFDTKAIAFGSCNDFLARWKKAGSGNETLLGTRISAFLDVVYDDEKNVEELVKFIRIMNPGVTAKYSQKPTMLELCWWLVTIRNKTRGHGTPSKVDFNFYIALEKAVLFMLAELAALQLEPCYISEVDSVKWSFSLWNGGYPDPVPLVDELQKNVHFNPMIEDAEIERMKLAHKRIVTNIPQGDQSLYLRVADDAMEEWWKCDNHFKVKDAIVHLLNQRDEKKESWISFSTGRIMRPEISEI